MPTDSLRERLLSPTSPGNLKKLTIQFPPSPTIPTRKQKPLNVSQMILRAMIPLLGFIIFVIAIWIYFLYAGFNYQSPSQGSGHEFTSSIIFKGIQNASILSSPPTKHLKDMKYCESGCMYFNPTLTFYNGQYIFAVRESSRQNCFGILGTILTLWKLFRPAISSVLIGVLPHDQRMDSQQTKTVNIDYRIPDYHLFNPNEVIQK